MKGGYEEKYWIFVKSLPEHGMGLNWTDKRGNLIVKQTTEDVFSSLTLQPNTKSFGLKERICFSHIFTAEGLPTFKESYRNSGVIFTYRDGDQEDLFFPCDLLALTTLNDMPLTKDEVFANIQTYYKSKIIKNWKLFGTKNIDEWIERMHSTSIISGQDFSYDELILELVNSFRWSFGYKPLSLEHHNRLVSHNECIKFAPLKIDILGVFGNAHMLKENAQKVWITHYVSLSDFMDKR